MSTAALVLGFLTQIPMPMPALVPPPAIDAVPMPRLYEPVAELDYWRQYWLDLGVMTKHDIGSFFIAEECLDDDQECMIGRFKRINNDTPPVTDYFKLPPEGVMCDSYVAAKAEYVRLLTLEQFLSPAQRSDMQPLLIAQKWRADVWLQMSYAVTANTDGLRLSLKDLRDLVGQDIYDRAAWPEPVIDNNW